MKEYVNIINLENSQQEDNQTNDSKIEMHLPENASFLFKWRTV